MMPVIRAFALAAVVATLAACASPPPSVTPKLQLERIVVAPLNLSVRAPRELADRHDPVWRELVAFLRSQNQRISVLEPVSAGLLWDDTLEDMTHADTRPELKAALSNFARQLSEQTPFDLLVVPSLVLRRARISGEIATWDGVRRRLPLLAPAEYELIDIGPYTVSKRGFRGSVAAASLHVMLIDAAGEIVFDGLGGLDLVQEADRDLQHSGSSWTLATRENPFDIPDHLREGIGLAFESEIKTRSAQTR